MTSPHDQQPVTCTLSHAEHSARWLSWLDDCDVCGYTRLDVDQCERGHPDDGVTWCGLCGHNTATDHHTTTRTREDQP